MNPERYPAKPILVVDDLPAAVQLAERMLTRAGFTNLLACHDSREVLDLVETHRPGLILLDLAMPFVSGEQILEQVAEHHSGTGVIVVTGIKDVDKAVDCMRAGALDYLVKPIEETRLTASVRRAVELAELRQEYTSFRARTITGRLEHPEAFEAVVAQDASMLAVLHYMETVAANPKPLLFTGETGTGKELIARATHGLSRVPGEFVTVNAAECGGADFAEAVFGRVGPGTDADRPGLVERAARGTLFIDEIGVLDFDAQSKVLRLIQHQEYLPSGADFPRKARVRVMASSHRDLALLHRDGHFLSALFYQLCARQVYLPPLRERTGDLPLLLAHFFRKAAGAFGLRTPAVPPGLCALLGKYPFPGNVRELETMVYEVLGRAENGKAALADFQEYLGREMQADMPRPGAEAAAALFAGATELPSIQEVTRALIEEALARTGNNQSHAAELLGITQSALSQRLKRLRNGDSS